MYYSLSARPLISISTSVISLHIQHEHVTNRVFESWSLAMCCLRYQLNHSWLGNWGLSDQRHLGGSWKSWFCHQRLAASPRPPWWGGDPVGKAKPAWWRCSSASFQRQKTEEGAFWRFVRLEAAALAIHWVAPCEKDLGWRTGSMEPARPRCHPDLIAGFSSEVVYVTRSPDFSVSGAHERFFGHLWPFGSPCLTGEKQRGRHH